MTYSGLYTVCAIVQISLRCCRSVKYDASLKAKENWSEKETECLTETVKRDLPNLTGNLVPMLVKG